MGMDAELNLQVLAIPKLLSSASFLIGVSHFLISRTSALSLCLYIHISLGSSLKASTGKYEIRGTTRWANARYQIPLSTTDHASRSTQYKEVRDTMKCEIPGRAKYTGLDNIPGSHKKYYPKVKATSGPTLTEKTMSSYVTPKAKHAVRPLQHSTRAPPGSNL